MYYKKDTIKLDLEELEKITKLLSNLEEQRRHSRLVLDRIVLSMQEEIAIQQDIERTRKGITQQSNNPLKKASI